MLDVNDTPTSEGALCEELEAEWEWDTFCAARCATAMRRFLSHTLILVGKE